MCQCIQSVFSFVKNKKKEEKRGKKWRSVFRSLQEEPLLSAMMMILRSTLLFVSFLLLLLLCVCNTTPSLCYYPLFESTHPSFVRPPKTELTRLKVAQPGKKGEIDDGGRLILSINPKTVSHRSHLFFSSLIFITKSLSLSLSRRGKQTRKRKGEKKECFTFFSRTNKKGWWSV